MLCVSLDPNFKIDFHYHCHILFKLSDFNLSLDEYEQATHNYSSKLQQINISAFSCALLSSLLLVFVRILCLIPPSRVCCCLYLVVLFLELLLLGIKVHMPALTKNKNCKCFLSQTKNNYFCSHDFL